jgi:hypothetical protein
MSVLGQKRTFASGQPNVRFAPIADITAQRRTANLLLLGTLSLEGLSVNRTRCGRLCTLILLGLFLLAVTFLLFAHSLFPQR